MITFNGIDLTPFGLEINKFSSPISQMVSFVNLEHRSFAFKGKKVTKPITIGITVFGTNLSDILDKLDSITFAINQPLECPLILNHQPDRYWMVHFSDLTGDIQGESVFSGQIKFNAGNPTAYGISEIDKNISIDEDPKNFTETTGGNALIYPTWSLTGSAIPSATVKVENESSNEELTWTGALVEGDVLEIDTENWIVYLNSVPSMNTVSGKFPKLLPNQTNNIKITGFGTTGTVNLKYRNRFG